MTAVTPAMKPYRPYGAARDLFLCKDQQILIEGPAGTGKSIGALSKMHLCCEKYAGSRWLLVRKTRASLSESGLVTFEEEVVPEDHAILDGPTRETRRTYRYPNGSRIVVGGMDRPGKIMSTQFDGILVLEATELSEDDWEKLTTRLRHHLMPYQQIIGDCNPDHPYHWLNKRCERGQTTRLLSRHRDNPMLFDHERDEWTENGRRYVDETLGNLTGVRKLRLHGGLWAAAEGMIYDGWDPAVHLIDRRPLPADWERIWVVDFGFTNPFVWQHWAIDPDRRIYLIHEIYMTRRIVKDHAQTIKRVAIDLPRPRAIVCDHDAEDRATLEAELGMSTIGAYKSVSPGIQATQDRLRIADDGKPRLFVMRDTLVERDPALAKAGKPTCLVEEIGGYVWDTATGVKRGEAPLKRDDHAMDDLRYAVAFVDDLAKSTITFYLPD